MKQPNYADMILRRFYPELGQGDPGTLAEFGHMYLKPEVEGVLNRYYGGATPGRRKRWPGINYNDPAWRMRLCQMPFQYHPRLFQIMNELRLTPHVINNICTWWGTKADVDECERRNPDCVVHDDVWDGIEDKRCRFSTPLVTYPEDQPRYRPSSPSRTQRRRRSTSIRHLLGIGRPRGITSITQLHQEAPTYGADEEDVVRNSVGVSLNNQLQAGIRNTEFEDWLKEETENGRLFDNSSSSRPLGTQLSPFTLNTNTISYSAPTQVYEGHGYGDSYSRRIGDRPYQGDLHTLPVAISGPFESALRSSQPRQRTLTRYRTPGIYNLRPIRPRPAHSSNPS